MAPEELLIKISNILKKLKITYAITGGYAVSVWGRPRYTADIDIIVEMEEKNIKPLARELLKVEKNVYADEDMMREALINNGEFNFIEPDFGLKIDFFVQDKSAHTKLKLKRAVLRDIFGHQIYFVTPEDFILSKLIWSKESVSFKQFEDIKTVLKNDKITLDMEYIKNWAEKQNTIEILNTLLSEIK